MGIVEDDTQIWSSRYARLYVNAWVIIAESLYLIIYMETNEEGQSVSLQLDVRAEVARGIYSNLVLINHSPGDFVIDFAQVLPGMQKPEVASRIIMSPEHAKRLLMALQENVYKYEQTFGRINIGTPDQGMAVKSFVPGKGEA